MWCQFMSSIRLDDFYPSTKKKNASLFVNAHLHMHMYTLCVFVLPNTVKRIEGEIVDYLLETQLSIWVLTNFVLIKNGWFE